MEKIAAHEVNAANERIKALSEKLDKGLMSTVELAEYKALRAFPDNERGAILEQKNIAKNASPEELAELEELKAADELLAPDIAALWEEYKNREGTSHMVDMNDAKTILISFEEDVESVLWTQGISECTVIALVAEEENKRDLFLSHYSLASSSQQLEKVRELESQINFNDTSKVQAIVLALEAYSQDQETKLWSRLPASDSVKEVVDELERVTGGKAQITIKYYPLSRVYGKEDRDRSLKLVSAGNGPILCQTWFDSERI